MQKDKSYVLSYGLCFLITKNVCEILQLSLGISENC